MEISNDRKTRITKGIAGFSSASLIAIASYFYSFFSEKIPAIEEKISLVEKELTNNTSVNDKYNKQLMEKIEYMREDIKEMRQTQEKVFELLIKISRDR